MPHHISRLPLLAMPLLAASLLITACSSGSSSPSVASAGTPGPGNGGTQSSPSSQSGLAAGIAYAKCMRSHGEPSFPDPAPGPNGKGYGWLLSPSQANPDSPQYQAATKACGQPPNLGGAPPPALTSAQEHQYLKWAACIRSHGVPSFKDPTFAGGYPRFSIPMGTGGAGYAAAQAACKSYLNGIPGGGGVNFNMGGQP